MDSKQILAAAGATGDARYVSDVAYWLTEDGKVVGEDHAEKRYVLVGAGGNLPLLVAQALGFTGTKKEQSDAVAQIESGEPTFPVVVHAEKSEK